MVFPEEFTVSHSRATEAKCYFKGPFNQFINEHLLEGTGLGSMESTRTVRPTSLPPRSLQPSGEDEAYRQRQSVTIQAFSENARSQYNRVTNAVPDE